ncbi:acyl-CoA synthetase family member 4 -like, partial [Asbolus verrucosus]
MDDLKNNKAIILSDGGVIESMLTYEDVGKIRDRISEFIAKYVTTKHLCIGLKMTHNIYIPSLVLRTSGTTGQNKFVHVGKHCIESNITSLSRIFRITSSDTIYFGTPLTFDPSMIELLLAIHNNACLLITLPKTKLNPALLYKTLFHTVNGVNILQIVPSLFMRWSQQHICSILMNHSLKILAFGGEQFPQSILHYQKSDSLRIFNLYGITEVSCWASAHEISLSDDPIPIGKALDDTIIEIRDDNGSRVVNGEGEIYVGSDSRVCLIDDEVGREGLIFRETGDVGVVSNGNIFYKGRKNDAFKRWGHKIHLSKIEELVERATGLDNKCVWVKSKSKLLLFLIHDHRDNNTKDKVIDKIRIKLLHALPRHYFPDYIDFIRKCPITVHGKVNKKVLEAIYLKKDKNKSLICVDTFKSLICKYFGLDHCQLDDLANSTFFDIGGNSILAIQLLNEFKDELGIEYPPDLPTALFEKDLGSCFDCLQNVQVIQKRNQQEKYCISTKKIKTCQISLKIVWCYNLHACVDSSPLVFTEENRIVVAVGSFSHIFAVVDGVTGEEINKFVLPDVVESSPCLSPCHNYLYVGCFDGKIYCLDWRDGKIQWAYSTGDRIKCRPVLCQGSTSIVFGSYDKHVHCVNILKEGTLVWKTFTSESLISSPLVEDGKIFIATICGTCLCLSEITGTILWKYKSGSPIFGGPCFCNNMTIWPGVQGKVVGLTNDGVKKWHFECGGHLYSSLLLYNDFVIFGCHDQNLYILQVSDSVELARVVSLDKISCGATTCEVDGKRVVVVATDDGCIYLVDFEGFVVGDIRLPNQIFSSVTTWKDKIYVG